MLTAERYSEGAEILRQLLYQLLEMNVAFPSVVADPLRAKTVASHLGFEWFNGDARGLSDLSFKLLSSNNEPEILQLVDVLRSEVDWTLSQSATGNTAAVAARSNVRAKA